MGILFIPTRAREQKLARAGSELQYSFGLRRVCLRLGSGSELQLAFLLRGVRLGSL